MSVRFTAAIIRGLTMEVASQMLMILDVLQSYHMILLTLLHTLGISGGYKRFTAYGLHSLF